VTSGLCRIVNDSLVNEEAASELEKLPAGGADKARVVVRRLEVGAVLVHGQKLRRHQAVVTMNLVFWPQGNNRVRSDLRWKRAKS
jgi:hypothetical protein